MKKNTLSIILATTLLLVAITYTVAHSRLAGTDPDEMTAADTAQVLHDPAHIRPLRDVHFAATAQRVARGGYLANGILMCFTCHSPRDWKQPGAPPIEEKKGSGGTVVFQDSLNYVIAPNITSDRATGAGKWTDDMLSRAIREGIGHDGRVLNWNMPWYSFRALSDEDLASVVVYLRTLPAIRVKRPRPQFPDEEWKGMLQGMQPLTKPVPERDLSTPEKRGSYLVQMGECAGCHTAHAEYNPGIFGGGNFITRWKQGTYSANITPDSSGLHYSLAGFMSVIRSGKGGTLGAGMPWTAFRNLNDSDLSAIYAYLKSFPPVRHYVANQKPFTKCEVCGETHGQGEYNHITVPKGIAPPTGLLDRYVGEYDDTVYHSYCVITIDKNKLYGQTWNQAPKQPVIFTSDSNFIIPGWFLPLRFVRGSDGSIAGVKEYSDIGREFIRKK